MFKFEFKLRVSCMTFNHSKYIEDALKGFCMQQTDFPFVCTIIDDASTDGEQAVLERYVSEHFDLSDNSVAFERETSEARVTFAQHKENKSCYFVVIYLKENHYSQRKSKAPYVEEWDDVKYIALCEGDDYWTDPLKLQKQVDFLETHEEFSMCFHAAKLLFEVNRNPIIDCENLESREYLPDDVFPKWVSPTASFLYRKSLVKDYPMKHPEWLVSGDTVLVLKCMHRGRVWCMSDQMSVYRINAGSVMNKPNDLKSIGRYIKHLKCILLNFPKIDREYIFFEIVNYDLERFHNNDGEKSRWNYLLDAWRWAPKYMINFCCTTVKRKIKRFIKKLVKK